MRKPTNAFHVTGIEALSRKKNETTCYWLFVANHFVDIQKGQFWSQTALI
jgi:hypothetical protein